MSEETKAPLVGQFSGPPGNGPRVAAELPRKPVPQPAKEELTPPEVAVAKEEKKDESRPRPRTPQEKAKAYQEGLAAVGISGEEARGILEKVLVNGFYEESKKMGPIEVVIRTRNYKDVTRTLRFLELEKPTYAIGINDVVARYNMAASLSKYGDTVFVHPSKRNKATEDDIENAFHERLAFVMELPTAAADRLQQLVYDFDQKIGAAFAEGAPEDF